VSEARLEPAGAGTLAVSGELTFQTVPRLHAECGSDVAAGGEVVLDLSGVTRTDSAGVALLVDLLRQARAAGGDLRFLHVPEQMRSIVRVSGLERLLSLSEDV